MMFVGALVGFKVGSEVDPWLGVVLAMAAGALLSLLHGIVSIHLQANQIVSGLALTFLGTGVALVLGEGLSSGSPALLPVISVPLLSEHPLHRGRLLLGAVDPRLPGLPARAPRRRCGSSARGRDCTCGPSASSPAPRMPSGSTSTASATPTRCWAAPWPGWPAPPSRWRSCPGWHADKTVIAQGWIAVALVIFGQWKPAARCSAPT